MIQGMNRIGQSWLGRVIVAVMFGFLIISFAVWGIGDIFRGNVRTQVATVGRADISADAFRTAYQTEYQGLVRRVRQGITPEQARAIGLDRRVLARLVSETALDQRARELGLRVSDQVVAQTIQSDATFRGPNGAFDRAQFTDILRSSGLSEPQYVREQRALVTRLEIGEAVGGALPVPLALREAIHRYETERRSAESLTLGPAAVGEIAAPTEAQLQPFFDERKNAYRAPEYRTLNVLSLDATALAKSAEVTDAEARRLYETMKDGRFGTSERRTIEQIVFPTRGDAEAAFGRIRDGLSFEALAQERGIDAATLQLGTFTRAEMIDPPVGDAAFSLAEGAVSGPVEGRFGTVLVRAAKVEQGSTKSFEEVAGEVRQEAALAKARRDLQVVHDAIEDQRAAARPLAEIAREKELTLLRVAATDREGRDKAGATVTMPRADLVLPAAFRSDIGADNEALRTPDGAYVWFEVAGVEPGRERNLAEVRDRVAGDWRRDEIARRLTERAAALVERLDGGTTLDALAAETGAEKRSLSDLRRSTAAGGVAQAVVTRIFATPVGKAASAAESDEARTVFKVTGATVPPFITTTQQAAGIETQLRSVLSDEILAGYVAEAEKQIGVSVYPENMRRAIGGES